MPEASADLIVCRTCNGDPRASATCPTCHGAGVGLASPDGYLVWLAPVDDFTISFRQLRLKLNASIHLSLAILGVAGFAAFVFGVLRSGSSLSQMLGLEFWASGHWYVTAL